jgi:hypothetical protein
VTEEDKITQFLSNFQELEDIINEKGGHRSRFDSNLTAVSESNALCWLLETSVLKSGSKQLDRKPFRHLLMYKL